MPTLDQIPGNDQREALDQELEQVRSTLSSLKERGKVLRSYLDAMNKTLHLSEQQLEVLSKYSEMKTC